LAHSPSCTARRAAKYASPTGSTGGPPYTYDLTDAGEVAVMYETVIREARDPADLAAFLDADTLRALWPSLFLPAPARALWEARFPELRQAAAAQ